MPVAVVNPNDPVNRHHTFIADTQALAWFLAKDARLSGTARRVFERVHAQQATLVVPTVALAELVWMIEKERTPLTIPELLDFIQSTEGLVLAAFDLPELHEFMELGSGLEMHDRIIVATARLYDAAVVTNDPEITAGSLVESVW
jgi:predicted nucleic acid-binding protein